MMAAIRRYAVLELLEDCLRLGIRLEADRARNAIAVEPASKLTPTLRQRIRCRKPDLLDVLDPEPPEGPCRCGSAAFVRQPLGPWECLSCTDLTAPERAEWYYGPTRWLDGDRP